MEKGKGVARCWFVNFSGSFFPSQATVVDRSVLLVSYESLEGDVSGSRQKKGAEAAWKAQALEVAQMLSRAF